MLNIYHFILDHRVGGPHVYIENLNENLISDANLKIVTAGKGKKTDIALINLRTYSKYLYLIEIFINIIFIILIFRKNKNSNVFCVHGAANIAPLIAARIMIIPFVWYFHETLLRFSPLVIFGKKLINKNSKIVIVAKKAKEIYNIQDSIFIPPLIDVSYWNNLYLNKNNNKFRIISVGNINRLKGYDILLDAVKKINFEFELNIVGNELNTQNKYYEALKDQANILNKKGIVINFLGWQTRTEIKQLLNESDIFVLSSRSEACPISLLEAMSSSLPCIATNVGDIPEIITQMENGVIINKEDPQDLADAITLLYKIGSKERLKLGENARKYIVQNYSVDKYSYKHLSIYNELILGKD
jgi:glycosyltransferase involved in cell wall biosynthesis